jgi:hypothetical protein
MPITRTPIIDDDLTGTTGTPIDNAWKQEFYDQIDDYVSGVWQYPAFNAGNFSAQAPGVWTVTAGQVAMQRWQRFSGRTICYQVYVNGGALSGGNCSALYINLFGAVPYGSPAFPLTYFNQTQQQCGVVTLGSGVNYLTLQRDFFGTPWVAGQGIYLAFSIEYETV